MRTAWRTGVIVLTAVIMIGLPATAAARPLPQNVLEVITVPPLPSSRFTLDGTPIATDDKGVASAVVRRSRAKHQLRLLTPHLDLPGTSADFVRWVGRQPIHNGDTAAPLDLVIGRHTRIQAAFQTTKTVGLEFFDQAHRPVPPDRITSLTIRGDSGENLVLDGVRPIRLTAIRPVPQAGTAIGKEVTYYLQSVIIDGTNVVNAGQQRLTPNRTTDAKFVVLLRSVRFQIRDWLFGGPLATGVELTYPDGRSARVSAGLDGDVTLENLARGTYQVEAAGRGYSPAQEITLSRSQYVELTVMTWVDIAALGLTALATLSGLVVAGRRRRERSRTVA